MSMRTLMVDLAGTMASLILTTAPAMAQQPMLQDDLLDRLVGHWTLSGTIAGQETKHDVDAEWVLNHQYVKIHEVSHERDAAGRPRYEANVFIGWHAVQKRYVCIWI